MPRIVVVGNSGSGKSFLSGKLAREWELRHLDLDTLAWEKERPTERRPLGASLRDIARFMDTHEQWVIEGCYANLLAPAVARCTRLVFLNPGTVACIENCRKRPWEPHKYATPEAQDQNLEMLIAWVREYESRQDEYSL